MKVAILILCGVILSSAFGDEPATRPSDAIVLSEFIFDKAPFPSCHASTVVETKHGLVAAWFGGTRERAPDVGIWVSRHDAKQWSPPVEVANGIQEKGDRLPTWNPALFQPRDGPLMLFYKVGPSPSAWWGMVMSSSDDGVTWSAPQKRPEGILGPVKDKPVQLADGTILSPSSTENGGWRILIERSTDGGKTWTKSEPLNDPQTAKLIQPTILDHGDGNLQILCRSQQQKIYESWSRDGGKTWSEPTPTELPNPNSGIDAVQLKDGRSLIVYNHSPTARTPIHVAVSKDGKTWSAPQMIEEGEGQYSYPAVIQTSDGMVHITYTWRRLKIRHVVLDPGKL
jgi:predicted neuraminidase